MPPTTWVVTPTPRVDSLQLAFSSLCENTHWLPGCHGRCVQAAGPPRGVLPHAPSGPLARWRASTYRPPWTFHSDSFLHRAEPVGPPSHGRGHGHGSGFGYVPSPSLGYGAVRSQNKLLFTARLGDIANVGTVTPRGSCAWHIHFYQVNMFRA